MKRWIWLIVLTLMAVPALAQDEGEGGGGDFFDLSSMGEFGNVTPDFDPLLEVRNLLAQAKVAPMDKQQEKDLKKIYDKEVKVVAKPYEQRFNLNLKTTMGSLQASSARGRRGGGGGRGGVPSRPEPTQVAEARRLATVLVDKMIAGLRIDQQGPLRRHQSEQARITKLNTLTSSVSRAGTPLTSTQLSEVEAILARESRLRTLVIVEAKGGPYQSQIFQLEAQTKQRVVDVLDPSQKIAYAEATSPAPAQPARQPARPPVRRGTN
jgi:hypothetical protein